MQIRGISNLLASQTAGQSQNNARKTSLAESLTASVQKTKAQTGASLSKTAAKAIAKSMARGVRVGSAAEKYVMENYPELYREAVRINQERMALERRLAAAKTRQEAQHIMAQAQANAAQYVDKLEGELAGDVQELYSGAFDTAWQNAARDKRDSWEVALDEQQSAEKARAKEKAEKADEDEIPGETVTAKPENDGEAGEKYRKITASQSTLYYRPEVPSASPAPAASYTANDTNTVSTATTQGTAANATMAYNAPGAPNSSGNLRATA